MRCDQLIGLTAEALDFLCENGVPAPACGCCGRALAAVSVVKGFYYGMFNERYDLRSYSLKTGGRADEFLQASPWSSGPCFFLGLEVLDSSGKQVEMYEWPEDEINNC